MDTGEHCSCNVKLDVPQQPWCSSELRQTAATDGASARQPIRHTPAHSLCVVQQGVHFALPLLAKCLCTGILVPLVVVAMLHVSRQ